MLHGGRRLGGAVAARDDRGIPDKRARVSVSLSLYFQKYNVGPGASSEMFHKAEAVPHPAARGLGFSDLEVSPGVSSRREIAKCRGRHGWTVGGSVVVEVVEEDGEDEKNAGENDDAAHGTAGTGGEVADDPNAEADAEDDVDERGEMVFELLGGDVHGVAMGWLGGRAAGWIGE